MLERRDRGVRVDAAIRIWSDGPVDLGREGPEAGLVGAHLARHGHRQQRAAVEAVVEDDDAGAAGRRTRDLDRVLDRLGARVHQDRLLVLARARRVLGEPPAHLDVGLVGADHEALVEELVDLLVDRCNDRREPVPRVLARDPAREIEVDGCRRPPRPVRPRRARPRAGESRRLARHSAAAPRGRRRPPSAPGETRRDSPRLSRRAQWTAGRRIVSSLRQSGAKLAFVHHANTA